MSLCLGSSHNVAAQQKWWFDVEVIIFKHETATDGLSEEFNNQPISTTVPKALDILSPYLYPDLSYLHAGLPFCTKSARAAERIQFEKDYAFTLPVETSEISVTNEGDFENDNVATLPEKIKTQHNTSMNWIEWQVPASLPCVYSEQRALLTNPFTDQFSDQPLLADHAPVKINGLDWQRKGQAYLLPQKEFNLRNLFNTIDRQRDLKPMLHVSWRQEVKFGRSKAQAIRLFAGENYGVTYLPDGHKKLAFTPSSETKTSHYTPLDDEIIRSEEEQSERLKFAEQAQNTEMFKQIYASLDNETESVQLSHFFEPLDTDKAEMDSPLALKATPKDIWQLDGKLKVYLQNVGRTPYLHVDSDFDFRQPTVDKNFALNADGSENNLGITEQANKLNSTHITHFKRVISKQLHYFDHPLFGMVVYITRYHWPQEPVEKDDIN